MITREEAEGLREQLQAVLAEDAHNTGRLLARLDAITQESGIGAHAALLLILTRLSFAEEEARRHWRAILKHRDELQQKLGRDPGVRVAVLDYFMHVNRRLLQPTLIDLELIDSLGRDLSRDLLTGLASEIALRQAVQRELRRARRYAQTAAIVLFDLDDFAAINARVGSIVGDRLLREAAILLSNNIRDIDVAARPGEDELALLLPETDRSGALLVAERFRRELAGFFSRREAGGRPVGLTVSGGVACYPDDAPNAERLFECAARALYEAKASGRDAIQVHLPERRRYLRFELEPGRFEIEVLGAEAAGAVHAHNFSRNGILFSSPEPLDVGERIEIRLAEPGDDDAARALRIRGKVVRLEELPTPGPADEGDRRGALLGDRFEIGVAFDLDCAEGNDDLLGFLEKIRRGRTRV